MLEYQIRIYPEDVPFGSWDPGDDPCLPLPSSVMMDILPFFPFFMEIFLHALVQERVAALYRPLSKFAFRVIVVQHFVDCLKLRSGFVIFWLAQKLKTLKVPCPNRQLPVSLVLHNVVRDA